MQIFNFKTRKYDTLAKSITAMTKDELRPYLPQDAPHQNLFECYIMTGKTPFEAYGATLQASVGEH